MLKMPQALPDFSSSRTDLSDIDKPALPEYLKTLCAAFSKNFRRKVDKF
jgi:hypothetical protein